MGFRKDYLDVGAKPAAEKVRTAVRSARDAWPPHKHQQRPCSISVQSLLQLERSTRLSGQSEAKIEGEHCDGADRGEDICHGAHGVGCGADDLELGRTPAHRTCLGGTPLAISTRACKTS